MDTNHATKIATMYDDLLVLRSADMATAFKLYKATVEAAFLQGKIEATKEHEQALAELK